MIECWFYLRIHCYGSYAELEHEAKILPFVPEKGMKFLFHEDSYNFLKVSEITWCVPQECFWVEFIYDVKKHNDWLDGDDGISCSCRPEDDCCKSLANAIKGFTDEGWTERERQECKATKNRRKRSKRLAVKK